MKSKTTVKYRRLAIAFYILSTLAFLAPLVTYFVIGILSEPTNAQIKSLIACGVACLFFFIIDLIRHGKYRTVAWTLLTAICIVCNAYRVQWCIFITTGCVILDELVFTPLRKHYWSKAKINNEIDKRLN